MLGLVRRNLLKHPVRSLLTVAALTVAIFLLCLLASLLTALGSGVEAASERRLWVQSAVSLFVDLPLSYGSKIAAVEGVGRCCRFQWFGGYYQDQSNFFAQFAVDPDRLLPMWPEMEIVEGSVEDFVAERTACVIGRGLAEEFGWKVGDTVPIIGALFPRPDGSAWEFQVRAIYAPRKATLDERTMFFHWDYFEESMAGILGQPPNVGVYVIELAPGADATDVMTRTDALFVNGPQRVQTTTESEFNRQFVSMVGNVPKLLGAIGGGVFVAILLACVNTMLMAAREQTRDVGILKALGFTDGAVSRLQLAQSLVLCGAGGGLGILLALATQSGIAATIGRYFPGYEVRAGTVLLALALTAAVGILAGIVPARGAARLNAVEALRRH
jgi:putative ABC transport system permease protein